MKCNKKLLIVTKISIILMIMTSVVTAHGDITYIFPNGNGIGFSTIGIIITLMAGAIGGFLGVIIAKKIDT